MVKEHISVKFLLHLIGERPAVWDKTSQDFWDRKLKETSWSEICACINENFYSLSNKPKTEFTKMIMKKWGHIRDSWVKSMKHGYDEDTKLPPKPYVYHNELTFMQKNLKCKPHRYDLSMCQPSSTHFEEFFRGKSETQTSDGILQDTEDNEVDEEKQIDVALKKENKKFTEAEESDEWQLEEAEITPALEVEEEKTEKTEPTKKKRTSIFVSGRSNENNYIEQKVSPSMFIQTPENISRAASASTNQSKSNFNFIEERHWSFFRGIVPSISSLDEDHILQFQSGVISLLQKLRENQRQRRKQKLNRLSSSNSSLKGRSKKRKTSEDEEDWATSNNYGRKKSKRQKFDPIAPEYEETEAEYSSDD